MKVTGIIAGFVALTAAISGFAEPSHSELLKRLDAQDISLEDFRLPCVLSKLSPKLFLYGEKHGDYAESIKSEHVRNAFSGSCYMGNESMYCGSNPYLIFSMGKNAISPRNRFFGIEEPLSHGLNHLLSSHLATFVRPPSINELGAQILSNPHLKAAWKRLSTSGIRPFSDANTETLALFIDSIVKESPTLTDLSIKIGQLSPKHPSFSAEPLRAVYHQWSLSYLDEIEMEKRRGNKIAPRHINEWVKKYLSNPSVANWKPIEKNIILGWRDKIMARNILRLYCLAQDERVSLVVFVGKDHVSGIENSLFEFAGPSLPLQVNENLAVDEQAILNNLLEKAGRDLPHE